MEFNLKKIIFLLLASLFLSCSNDEDIDPTTTADLGIAVAVSSNRPIANTNMTLTIIATNKGPMDATDVIVENKIPSGYTFVSADPSLGNFDQETGIWTIGDFENGANALLIIKLKVNESGDYNNIASISGEQTDVVLSNNDLTNVITLKPLTNDLLFTYQISDGPKPEVTITGLSQLWKDLSVPSKYDLILPESIEGYPVTVIGSNAFQSQSDILSVSIPNGIKKIGSYAFAYCYDMTSINIPANVANIEAYAFSYCQSLKTILIPNSNATLDYGAFDQCSGLTNITLPDNLKIIESNMFAGCSSLENIIIPNTVETIMNSAFSYCTNLKTIAIPNSLNSLQNSVFESCSSLENFTSETNSAFSVIDGVLYDKNATTLLSYPNGKSGSFSIPESVTKIGQSAFSYSGKLTAVTIPNSVDTIDSYAFVYCSGLTTVTIPVSVKNINSYAFGYNTNLTSVIVNAIVPPITNQPFYNSQKIKSIKVPGSSVEFYKAASGWSAYKDVIDIQ